MFVSAPSSWHRAPETLGISKEIRSLGASLVLIQVIDLCSQHRAPETFVISWVKAVSFVLEGNSGWAPG